MTRSGGKEIVGAGGNMGAACGSIAAEKGEREGWFGGEGADKRALLVGERERERGGELAGWAGLGQEGRKEARGEIWA